MPAGDFPVRPWLDDPDSGSPLANPSHADADQTPVDAAGLRDAEGRLSDYTDVEVAGEATARTAAVAAEATARAAAVNAEATARGGGDAAAAAALAAHAGATNAHGIPDPAALATLDDVDAAVGVERDARTAAIGALPPVEVTQAELDAVAAARQVTTEKGQPGGYAGLDMGGQVPLAQVPARRMRGAVSLTDRSTIYKQGRSDCNGVAGRTSHHRMLNISSARGQIGVLDFGNQAWGGVEDATNNLNIDATVVTAQGRIYRAYSLLGFDTLTLTPGAIAQMRVPGLEVDPGEAVYVRTWYRGDAPGDLAPNDWATDTNVGSWLQDGNHLLDDPATPPAIDSAAFVPQTFFYSPMALRFERYAPADIDCLGHVGDSNSHAFGSAFWQIANLAAEEPLPYVRATAAGASGTQWTKPGTTANSTGKTGFIHHALQGCTIGSVALLTNDLGGITVAEGVAMLNRILDAFYLAGCDVAIVCTLPPAQDPTTDTPQMPASTTNRGVNAAIRNGEVTHPGLVIVVSDNGSAVSADVDGNQDPDGEYWLLDELGAPLGDGVHFGYNGHQRVADRVYGAALASARARVAGIFQDLPGPPVNEAVPVIFGVAETGQTLTASNGSWNPGGTYARQWTRGGVDIAGATGATYVVLAGDVGQQLRVRVRASNGLGFSDATSAPVTPQAPVVPVNTLAPALGGGTQVGQTATVTNGTWNNNPLTFTYQWKRDGVNIPGATAATYLLAGADQGHNVKCTVTASNAAGPASVDSNVLVPTAAFNIDALPGLRGYAFADSIVSADGTKVPAVGTAGLRLAETTVGNQPTIETVNGKRVIRFVRANTHHLGFSFPAAETQPWTIWWAGKFTDGPFPTRKMKFMQPNPGSVVGFEVAASVSPLGGPADGDIVITDFLGWASTTAPWDDHHVWCAEFDIAGGVSRVELDGVEIASGDVGTHGAGNLTGFHVGADFSLTPSAADSIDLDGVVVVNQISSVNDKAELLSLLTGKLP